MSSETTEDALNRRDQPFYAELSRIGETIGYGRAQQMLGELWDEMLHKEYGASAGRGQMGVSVKDKRPGSPMSSETERERVERVAKKHGVTSKAPWGVHEFVREVAAHPAEPPRTVTGDGAGELPELPALDGWQRTGSDTSGWSATYIGEYAREYARAVLAQALKSK